PGEWWWDQNHYSDTGKDESSYKDNFGQMIVEEPNENGGLKITRRVDDFKKLGEPWDCVGMIPAPGALLVGMGGNNSSGVGYYEIDGKTLKGKICDVDTVIPYAQT